MEDYVVARQYGIETYCPVDAAGRFFHAEGASGRLLEELIGKQEVEAYDEAMAALEPHEREAIVGRVELGLSYEELASAMARPSADAARMAVGRALLKLAKLLPIP